MSNINWEQELDGIVPQARCKLQPNGHLLLPTADWPEQWHALVTELLANAVAHPAPGNPYAVGPIVLRPAHNNAQLLGMRLEYHAYHRTLHWKGLLVNPQRIHRALAELQVEVDRAAQRQAHWDEQEAALDRVKAAVGVRSQHIRFSYGTVYVDDLTEAQMVAVIQAVREVLGE